MGQEPTRIRPEIQGLRAVAVSLVVIYHLWPEQLPGGYVGVDVFLVISGFLITSHLVNELGRHGRISLVEFWAKRARRLLPASFVTLLVVAVVTLLFVPDTYWRQYMGEIGTSASYVQNWRLAGNSVDYLAASNAASPVQHFWSLSLEEQFYLVWPVLLLVVALAARAGYRRVVLPAVIAVVTVASFVVSVVWTASRPSVAYFATPTRVWEFGVGGLLAFVPVATGFARVRAVAVAAGLVCIGASAALYSASTAFPGYTALLPVLGAAAVIVAGDPRVSWSATRAMGLRPVQTVGDLSYSLYLWHWPLIVLVPVISGWQLGNTLKVGILAASIAVASLSKVLIEDRFRRPGVIRARHGRVLVGVVAATVAFLVASSVPAAVLDARNERERDRILSAAADSCFGAAAMEPGNDCPPAENGMTPLFAKTDMMVGAHPDGGWKCQTPPFEVAQRPCTFGDTVDPERTIAMLGDSHAMHFLSGVVEVADRRGWQVKTFFRSGCPGVRAADVVNVADDRSACTEWGADALASIVADPTIDVVIFANISSAYWQDDGAVLIGRRPYDDAWRALTDAGKEVLVVADVPRTVGVDVPDCLAAGESSCDADPVEAFPFDAAADAAATSPDPGVHLLDLSDKFCRDDVCPAEIGGVVVYSDASHLTNTFARSLAPYFEVALSALLVAA